MDLLLELVVELSKWSRFHLSDISLAIMASALVLVGPDINARVRSSIGHLNFLLRTLAFILVCTLGYGLAMVYLTPILQNTLGHLNNYSLSPVVILIFLLIGILADRH
ncbi:DUF3392 family protein [Denitrificimonas sp. JX-1]|uniref:DUF3392 family protein n=1 Tax=Denitrificimonas halotolerans TaxID=3098930 RepID=A0ABU5GRY9_9GAMM|nr:DUF3392 family protein [Denitrificimonas sp. JX-1]MDY7219759.1 DUF3392 family protein [Denitrificimonas sp. JX-1]